MDSEEQIKQAFARLATQGQLADLALVGILKEIDIVFALHDAKVIDARAITNRWRHTAAREDLNLTDNIRSSILRSADIVDGTINGTEPPVSGTE